MENYTNLVAALQKHLNATRIEFNYEPEWIGMSCKFTFQLNGVQKYAKFMLDDMYSDDEEDVMKYIENIKKEMK